MCKIVSNSTKSVLLWLLKIFIFLNICNVSFLNLILTFATLLTLSTILKLDNILSNYPKHYFNTSLILLDAHSIKIMSMILSNYNLVFYIITYFTNNPYNIVSRGTYSNIVYTLHIYVAYCINILFNIYHNYTYIYLIIAFIIW